TLTSPHLSVYFMKSARPNLRLKPEGLKLNSGATNGSDSLFANFSKFVDPSGKLNFAGKAIVHEKGVDFSNGNSYKINMDELQPNGHLGKGMYGLVQKVYHRPTNVTMAMKEIRLELDRDKLNQILMELDVLHKSQCPYIVDFYGAFFLESNVYYCMEYMDAGSLDLLCWKGVPEDVLAQITIAMLTGLKFLKDELSIIHREAQDFVSQCLRKKPEDRPTYQELLDHPFLKKHSDSEVDMTAWAQAAYDNRKPPPKADA
ncbi:MAP kinase kinase Wis1, partial [Massospora cicadina]